MTEVAGLATSRHRTIGAEHGPVNFEQDQYRAPARSPSRFHSEDSLSKVRSGSISEVGQLPRQGPFLPQQGTCRDCIGMSVSCQKRHRTSGRFGLRPHVEAYGHARVESFAILIGYCRSLLTYRLRCHWRHLISSRGDNGASFWFARKKRAAYSSTYPD
jgi:hypothetical protein